MRLKTFVAADTRQAIALVRAELGADAIIVATQEVPGGGVRITGATEGEDVDLAELLGPPAAAPGDQRLLAVMTHHELPEPLARRLLAAAARAGEGPLETTLGHALLVVFRFAPAATQPEPLLLCGPPGAGKTASIAKLAAAAALAGRPVGVVCADTARAAGIEQLAALLAPLELRPEPAPDLASLRSAVARAGGAQLLIDSPGFNPFRPADLGLLSGLLEASRAVPVLVLPAGLGVADCTEIGHTYAALGARHLLATKLDAARRLGGLLAAADAGLAFAEAGIGRTIGQGLSALSARGLARLLLCQQELSAAGTAPATGKPK
jgi:flagellar biosynthesis protein FlhF